MTSSVHTNTSALIALQNLNRTNERLEAVQGRVNTGLKVQGAKDNASVWAIAQGQRADLGALSAVQMSLDRATSVADVALSAGETISDLLNQLKEKVVAANDESLKTQSRELLNDDFQALLGSIAQAVQNAEFDGANLLDGSTPFYRCYRCRDGGEVAVGALEPRFYAALLAGLGLTPEDAPQYDRSRWPEITGRFAAIFATRDRDDWTARFEGTEACVTPVLTLSEAVANAHNRARGTFDASGAPAPAPLFDGVRPGGETATAPTIDLPGALQRWTGATPAR